MERAEDRTSYEAPLSHDAAVAMLDGFEPDEEPGASNKGVRDDDSVVSGEDPSKSNLSVSVGTGACDPATGLLVLKSQRPGSEKEKAKGKGQGQGPPGPLPLLLSNRRAVELFLTNCSVAPACS